MKENKERENRKNLKSRILRIAKKQFKKDILSQVFFSYICEWVLQDDVNFCNVTSLMKSKVD